MKTSKKLLVAVSAVLALAMVVGCDTTDKYKGKTAQEWAAEAERNKVNNPNMQGKSNQQVQGEKANEKAAQEQKKAEAERAQKQKATDEAFLAKTDEQVAVITVLKDGKLIAEAAEAGLRHVDTAEVSLNHMAGLFLGETVSKLAPLVAAENSFEDVRPGYKIASEGYSRVRQAAVKWFVADPKRLDMVYALIRPVLRQKYALLNTLRGHESLFKVPYTTKGFAPLYECLKWHETLIYPQGDTVPIVPAQKDKDSCNKLFKSFGVKGVDFGIKNEDGSARDRANIAFDNTIWIVEFDMRNEARGGPEFAKRFHKLALDFID